MNMRRPVAGLLTALALVSGGALTACADPVNSTTGTPKDDANNVSGNDPGSVSQGNLPNLSDTKQSDRDQESGGP